jgi:hypothetical protein
MSRRILKSQKALSKNSLSCFASKPSKSPSIRLKHQAETFSIDELQYPVRTPDLHLAKSPTPMVLHSKCSSGGNLLFFPILAAVSTSRKSPGPAFTSKARIHRKKKFKSAQITENHRYHLRMTDESDSHKDLNCVTTPPDEEMPRDSTASPFADVVDKDLNQYMNNAAVGCSSKENKGKKHFFFNKELEESTPKLQVFSIRSKIIQRKRLRKLRII